MPKIIFLFSGQTRTNPLALHQTAHPYILESFDKYVFTPKFKSEIDYKVCLSVDNINIENTLQYFGPDKVLNIHLHDTDFYYKPVTPIKPLQHYQEKYNTLPRTGYWEHSHTVMQYYKLFDAFNLIDEDCDYIVRMRLDVNVTNNIMDFVADLEANPQKHIIMQSDIFAIGRKDIMQFYCRTIDHNFGFYTYNAELTEPPNICPFHSTIDKCRWMFAAETQVYETIFEYCKLHNLNINESIIGTWFCHLIK